MQVEEVEQWSIQQLGIQKPPSHEALNFMCRGDGEKLLSFLTRRVRSQQNVTYIRQNLRSNGIVVQENISDDERKFHLDRRREKAAATCQKMSTEIEALRKQLRELSKQSHDESQRKYARDSKQVIQHLEATRLEDIVSKYESCHREIESSVYIQKKKSESDHRLVQSVRDRDPNAKNELSTNGGVDGTDNSIGEEGSGCGAEKLPREYIEDRYNSYVQFRKTLFQRLLRKHIELATECEGLRNAREEAEKANAGILEEYSKDSCARDRLLCALLSGEHAAVRSMTLSIRSLILQTKELGLTVLQSTDTLRGLRAMEDDVHVHRGTLTALLERHVAQEEVNTDLLQELREMVKESLPKSISELRSLTREVEQTACHAARKIQDLNPLEERRVSLRSRRVPSICLSTSMRSRILDKNCSYEVLSWTSGVEGVFRPLLEMTVQREYSQTLRQRITALCKEVSYQSGAKEQRSRNVGVLEALQQKQQELTQELHGAIADTERLCASTIPRVAKETDEALHVWWDQPVRKAARWKLVDGKSMKDYEESLTSVCAKGLNV